MISFAVEEEVLCLFICCIVDLFGHTDIWYSYPISYNNNLKYIIL